MIMLMTIRYTFSYKKTYHYTLHTIIIMIMICRNFTHRMEKNKAGYLIKHIYIRKLFICYLHKNLEMTGEFEQKMFTSLAVEKVLLNRMRHFLKPR